MCGNIGFKHYVLMLALLIVSSRATSQEDTDPFGDAQFEIEQPVNRRNTPRRGQWVPSTYQDQAALMQKRATASIQRKLDYRLSTSAIASQGSNAPFWFVSNRQGLSSLQNSSGQMRMSAIGGMLLPSRFGVDYGMDVALAVGYPNSIYLHQYFADFKYRWIALSVGAKERWGELKNPLLSSGALTWSGNAAPIPQFRLEIPDYVTLNMLGGWFAVKGHVAYGKYLDNEYRKECGLRQPALKQSYTQNITHHSKAAFLKIGDSGRFPLEVIWGLEMYAQYGGELYNSRVGGQYQEVKRMPQGLDASLGILFPFNLPGLQGDENGNSLGSWHLSFDLSLERWRARAYYEHFYEDHSSMLGIEYKNNAEGKKEFVFYGYKRNWFDGLFGIELNAPDGLPFKNIVLEFLKTKDQCGSLCIFTDAVGERVDGVDSYYNHSAYQSYSHHGLAIGTPVLISPAYNDNGTNRFMSNRAIMFHIGVDGKISQQIDYRIMATTTNHWGTYQDPFNVQTTITSLMLECAYWLGDAYSWKFTLSGGLDLQQGTKLIGASNNKGVMLTISKVWDIL